MQSIGGHSSCPFGGTSLGITEGMTIRLILNLGDQVLCVIRETRIPRSQYLAENILVSDPPVL